MKKRKLRAQMWWCFQLVLLCVMISTPLWIRRDFAFSKPLTESLSPVETGFSSLESSQVLYVSYSTPESRDPLVVSTKQVRLSSKAEAVDVVPSLSSKVSTRFKKRAQKENWNLFSIERISPEGTRDPSSLPQEAIKVHRSEDDEVVSEYIELHEGQNTFELRYQSDTGKVQSKRLSFQYSSDQENL